MSTLVISDLAFLEELDNQESKVTGAASAGASSAADPDDAVAASGSTTNGAIYAFSRGGFRDWRGFNASALSTYVDVYGR